MAEYEVTSSRQSALTLSDPFSGDRNKDAIYSCPPSSYALSIVTQLVTSQTSTQHGRAAVTLSPCCAVWEDILTLLDTDHPLQLFQTFVSLPSSLKTIPSPPTVTVLRLGRAKVSRYSPREMKAGLDCYPSALLLWFLYIHSAREKAN